MRIGHLIRLGLLAGLVALGGCARGCTSPRPPIHPNPNMDQQPKLLPQEASDFFYDGATMRPPIEGTVARGDLELSIEVLTGKDSAGAFLPASPISVDEALIARGEERYGIYCVPCHGERGDGRGVLWERAQIESADLRIQRIRDLPDGQLYDVVTNGLGLMSGYRYPIPPRDRWAIIAFVRQLQERS